MDTIEAFTPTIIGLAVVLGCYLYAMRDLRRRRRHTLENFDRRIAAIGERRRERDESINRRLEKLHKARFGPATCDVWGHAPGCDGSCGIGAGHE